MCIAHWMHSEGNRHPGRRWPWVVGLFGLWLALLVLAYWYFLVKPQHWFDPQMQAPPVLAEPAEQADLRAWLQQRFPSLKTSTRWFVRWRQEGCGCERFVELYHQSFAGRADAGRMQVVTVDLVSAALSDAERATLRRWIPATPAVTVFNEQGELVYLGPYHQDGICNAENSYLEPVLTALQQGQPLTVLNTLVFGCFCHLP